MSRMAHSWAVRRLKRTVDLVNVRTDDQALPYLGLEHVEPWTGRLVNWPSEAQPVGSTTRFEPGDVLFGKLRPYLAKVVHATGHGRCSPELLVLRPRVHDSTYLHYCLLTDEFIKWVDATTYGSKMPRANWEDIGGFEIPVPPVPVQHSITEFLNEKTAAIDTLIERRARHIELLEEKREAAVTRLMLTGAAEPAAMKTSNVDWLGEIPAHWTVTRLRHVVPQITVGIVVTPSRYYVESGIPCLRSLNVRPNALTEEDLVFISPQSNELHRKSVIRRGDLVAVRTGKPGTTAVVDDRFDGGNVIDLIIIRRSPSFDSQFLSYYMNSALARHQFAAGAEGALQLHFNVETAKDLLVPLPSYDEQRQIATRLRDLHARTDALVGAMLTQIDKLREYRQVLISSAVTGQINVLRAMEVLA
jgi:type I restriction enzyme S subunit